MRRRFMPRAMTAMPSRQRRMPARRGHGMLPVTRTPIASGITPRPTTQPATPRPNQFRGSTQQGLQKFRGRFAGHRGPVLANNLNQRSADLRARLEAQMRARQQAPQPVFRGHGRGRLN
jgi:hypothetical protein